MLKKSMFLNPNVDLEGQEKGQQEAPQVPDELCRSCPSCKKLCFLSDLQANCFVCPDCGHHFRLLCPGAHRAHCRRGIVLPKSTRISLPPLAAHSPAMPKSWKARCKNSGEKEGVVTGFCQVGGHDCALFVMDSLFFMGSMGTSP